MAHRASPSTLEVFGEFTLDRGAHSLSRAGHTLTLSPKLFALLCYLIDHRDRVVSKDELFDVVWDGDAVVPEVLTTAIRALRNALCDSAAQPRFVGTVRGAGYRFVAPVSRRSARERRVSTPRVVRERHAHFVGRDEVLQRIDDAMMAEGGGARLVHVHGPGGMGKTSVLQELAYRCAERGLPFAHAHAEHADARSFERSVALAFGCETFEDLGRDAATPPRLVLFVDGLESLHAMGAWFLDALLPGLPDSMTLVIASRAAPPARWLSDAAWCAMALDVQLAPLGDEESRALLAARGLAPGHAEPILSFARGHPLTLALAAAVVERGVDPRDVPAHRDVVDSLVEVFAAHTPSPEHRRALELASLLSSTDESLLERLLVSDRSTEIFGWLSGLAFVRKTPAGVQVHELVRDALLAHLRWRNPEQLRSVAMRCYALHLDLLAAATEHQTRVVLTNRIMSLGRHHPALKPFYATEDSTHPSTRRSTGAEHDAAIAIVERHEGPESAEICRRWLESGLGELWIVDDGTQVPAGLNLTLALSVAALADFDWDPAMTSVRRHLELRAIGPEARIVVHRYMLARDEYQSPGVVMQRCQEIVNYGMHILADKVSHTLLVYGAPELWSKLNDFAAFEIIRGGFALGPRRYAVAARSWVDLSFRQWVDMIVSKVADHAPVAELPVAPASESLRA